MAATDVAQRVLDLVGGPTNVNDLTHCVTRLRFDLKDESKADTKALQADDAVLGVVKAGGQYQVVIGNTVGEVHDAMVPLLGHGTAGHDPEPAKKTNVAQNVINTVASLFTPLVPALAGGGIVKGLLVLAVTLGWMNREMGAYQILNAASDAVFYFIPILLAYTCARRFKSDPVVAMVIAGSLLYPAFVTFMEENPRIDFFGLPVISANYASSVIPIILAVWAASYLEKGLNKVLPGPTRMVMTPAIVLAVIVPLTLLVFGPFGTSLSTAIGNGFTWITGLSPVVAGAVFGGTYPLLVMFGMHRALVPIGINEVATTGRTALWAFTGPSNFADAGAAFAVALRARSRATRSVATAAGLTALCGITEPALYGVNLVFKRPMVGVLTGGAIGGAIAGWGGAHAYAVAIPSVLTIPAFIGEGFVSFLIAISVAFVVGFAISFTLGIKEGDAADELPTADAGSSGGAAAQEAATATTVCSPMSGEVATLDEARDAAFGSRALGDGVLIRPTSDEVVSPIDGEVIMVFPTNHAVGVRADGGAELLIHVGINTVSLQGKHFTSHVQRGDRVAVGQSLITFDRVGVEADGLSTESYVVVSNPKKFRPSAITTGRIDAGQPVFETTAKETSNA